ncbi:MAG: cell division protein FtsA [Dehalococcoidia bacterium]|nr:cell division protein FtsA [Dehalococcoidia bacterium]MEE2928873.1 cell division protein FtsA [Chloroflexota bacterium]
MSKETFYTAVDIGSNKVCSIVARVGAEGDLKILGTGMVTSQGMQKGRIDNIDEVKVAVKSSLEEAQRYIGRGVISGVYAGVSGTHISCLNTKDMMENPSADDDIGPQHLDQLIRSSFPKVDPSQEILHMIPIGYEVDGMEAVRNPAGLHAKQINVESHVVMGDAATLRNTVKAVEASRVSVKSLVVESLASAESTLTGDEKEMGAVLVDIGGGTIDLMIYRQGNPWYSAVIPVGGNQLTRDLAVAMRIPYFLAEDIKLKWGHALPELVRADEEVVVPSFQGQPRRIARRRDLCEPLQARMVEMLKQILLQVRQSGLRQLPNAGLVITGGCAELPGIRELALKTVGGPVRLAYPQGIAGLPTQLQKASTSTAVGLLLWGIKHQGERRSYSNGDRTVKVHKSLLERLTGGRKQEQGVQVG